MSRSRRQTPPELPKLLLLREVSGRGAEAHRRADRLHLRRVHHLCNDIIAEEGELQGTASAASSLRLAEWCRVCRRRRAAPELVAVPDVGHVCHRYVGAIRAAGDRPKLE